jgi:hypothetical protein
MAALGILYVNSGSERLGSGPWIRDPSGDAAELKMQRPLPLRPAGSAPQAIAATAPMRKNYGPALIPAG